MSLVIRASQTSQNTADKYLVFCFMFSLDKCSLLLKDELCFKLQCFLSTDFRTRIMPFLIKIFVFNCF